MVNFEAVCFAELRFLRISKYTFKHLRLASRWWIMLMIIFRFYHCCIQIFQEVHISCQFRMSSCDSDPTCTAESHGRWGERTRAWRSGDEGRGPCWPPASWGQHWAGRGTWGRWSPLTWWCSPGGSGPRRWGSSAWESCHDRCHQ